MLKRYNQVTDSELVGLLKLPSDIVSAYFAAVGALFNNFSSTDEAKTKALAASLKLELEQKKHEACLRAIAAKDEQAIKDLQC